MVCNIKVASFTDAWIETIIISKHYFSGLSHLLQMRGLKLFKMIHQYHPDKVASFTDAWIETFKEFVGMFEKEVASFTDAWIET